MVNVLTGTEVTWCYEIINTGDVAIDGIGASDDLYGLLEGQSVDSLDPGESAFLSLADAAIDDTTLSALAFGTDAATGSDVSSERDAAVVNVVNPSLNIDVTISLDGSCPGADSETVDAGQEVTYCYTVSNSGDTMLTNVIVEDAMGEAAFVELLAPGDYASFSFASGILFADVAVSASASATDEFGFPLYDADSALVDVLFADLAIKKDAPEKILTSSTDLIDYTLTVANEGQGTAFAVVVKDALPNGLAFLSASAQGGSCTFDGVDVICSLGDMVAGESRTIIIAAQAEISLAIINNVAFVSSDSPEEDLSDNSDSAETLVAPGATRTIGFSSRHPPFVAMCLDINGGIIDLGFTLLADEMADDQIDFDKDGDIETGLELAMGVLKSNIMRFTNKQKRSPVEKAQMQAGRQVLAAYCNETMLGGESSIDFDEARAILAGDDIAAMLTLNGIADVFNNSGDSVDLGINPGKANAKFPWDDPTDFND